MPRDHQEIEAKRKFHTAASQPHAPSPYPAIDRIVHDPYTPLAAAS